MNQFRNSSTLLTEIIKSAPQGKVGNKITSLSGLVQMAKIKPSIKTEAPLTEHNDDYYLALLRELYREVKFYYLLWKRKQSLAEARLRPLLMGFARTTAKLDEACKDFFFKSVRRDVEPTWFLIAGLTGATNVDGDYYRRKLFSFIKNSMQLTKEFKSALVHAKTNNLSRLLQKVFPKTTLGTQLALLDIMQQRQELDDEWLKSILIEADMILKKKVDELVTSNTSAHASVLSH